MERIIRKGHWVIIACLVLGLVASCSSGDEEAHLPAITEIIIEDEEVVRLIDVNESMKINASFEPEQADPSNIEWYLEWMNQTNLSIDKYASISQDGIVTAKEIAPEPFYAVAVAPSGATARVALNLLAWQSRVLNGLLSCNNMNVRMAPGNGLGLPKEWMDFNIIMYKDGDFLYYEMLEPSPDTRIWADKGTFEFGEKLSRNTFYIHRDDGVRLLYEGEESLDGGVYHYDSSVTFRLKDVDPEVDGRYEFEAEQD